MDELISLIANYGFPIVVATYLLIRMENKMNTLTESIKSLTTVIAECRFTNNLKSNAS